jgi:hypothetical protein
LETTTSERTESERAGLLIQAPATHYGILQAERGATVSEIVLRHQWGTMMDVTKTLRGLGHSS